MFSGIIEDLGRVGEADARDASRLGVESIRIRDHVQTGDSVAVNGVCLTVAGITDTGFVADVMPETLHRTTLGDLGPGDAINLELSLALGDRVGGHMVAGHVDGVGAVTALRDEGNARWATIDAATEVLHLVAEKGSVAVDGISLTVVDVFDSAFTVSLIPHTMAATTAGMWRVGSRVNLEVDLVARYVERALVTKAKRLAEI